VEDICEGIKNGCELINDSRICERYGIVINDVDMSVLECIWLEGNRNLTSLDFIEPKCILKVFIVILLFIYLPLILYVYMYYKFMQE
jgi:hypothetical protein